MRSADREHERLLRDAELLDAHRSRLYSDRRSAYTAFYRSYLDYRRTEVESRSAWGHMGAAARDPDRQAEFEPAEARWLAAFDRTQAARHAVEQALMQVELVASPSVRDTAASLRDLAAKASDLGLVAADSPLGDSAGYQKWDAYQAAERAVEEGEMQLREAVQVELELAR